MATFTLAELQKMLSGVAPADLAAALTPAQLALVGAALTQPQLDYIASKLAAVVPPVVPPVPELARLLYRTDFAGVTLAPITDAWNQGAWQDLLGTTANVWGGGLRLLSLTDPIQITPATIESVITHAIDPVGGRNGSPALLTTILRSQNGTDPQGPAATQAALHFLPKREEPTLYVSEWLKLQPDLVEAMAAAAATNAGWRVMFTFKTGSQSSGLNDGDYRFQLSVQTRDRPQPYWVLLADNNAGGNAPLVNNFALKNLDMPVPVGEWFRLEVYWRRSANPDGRFWVAVNGRVAFDRFGPNMGTLGLPINRIMAPVLYSGSRLPIYQWVDDVEVWDTFPLSATAHA